MRKKERESERERELGRGREREREGEDIQLCSAKYEIDAARHFYLQEQ